MRVFETLGIRGKTATMSDEIEIGSVGDKQSPSSMSNNRKRTRLACILCRSRKQKCGGQQPACSTCLVLDLACTYEPGPKRRGLPTGYVRSLELLLAAVFAVVPNGQSIIMELLEDRGFAFDSAGKLVFSGRPASESEGLRRLWISSGVPAELERQLTGLEADLDVNTSVTGIGRPLHIPGALKTASFPSVRASNDNPASRPGSLRVRQGSLSEPDRFLHLPQPPKNAHHLLEVYFTYTHCLMPVVERLKVFETLYSSPEALPTDDHVSTSVLWAILAYSSFRGRDSDPGPQEPDAQSDRLSPQQIYNIARSLVPNEEEMAELGHANALLILSLCLLHQHRLSAAWRLIGYAVRLALDIHQRQQEPNGAVTEEDRTWTLLGCFAIDTLISSQIGKPPHLRSSDVRQLPPLPETGPREWEPWEPLNKINNYSSCSPSRAISIFNQLISLMRILNDIRWQPWDPFSGDIHLGLLHRWINNLPQHCRISLNEHSGAQSTMTPPIFNLHLAVRSVLTTLKTEYDYSSSEVDRLVGNLSPSQLATQYQRAFQTSDVPAMFPCYGMFAGNGYGHSRPGSLADSHTLQQVSLTPVSALIMGPTMGSSVPSVPSPGDEMISTLDLNSSIATSDQKRR